MPLVSSVHRCRTVPVGDCRPAEGQLVDRRASVAESPTVLYVSMWKLDLDRRITLLWKSEVLLQKYFLFKEQKG